MEILIEINRAILNMLLLGCYAAVFVVVSSTLIGIRAVWQERRALERNATNGKEKAETRNDGV